MSMSMLSMSLLLAACGPIRGPDVPPRHDVEGAAVGSSSRPAFPDAPPSGALLTPTREPELTPSEEAERLIAAYLVAHPSVVEPLVDPPGNDREALSRVLPAVLRCANGRLADDGRDAASVLVVRVVIGADGRVVSATLDGRRSALHGRDGALAPCIVSAHAGLVFPPGAPRDLAPHYHLLGDI